MSIIQAFLTLINYNYKLKIHYLNPLTPVPAVTSLDLSSTSDITTFDQNQHHLYSTSARGNDLSNDAHARVINVTEPEICTKMLKKLSEKPRAKFPATTSGYSMVKIAVLMMLSQKFFNCKQAQQKVNHCSKKKRKREKGKAEKNLKNQKA